MNDHHHREQKAFRNWMAIIVGGLMIVVIVNLYVWYLAAQNPPNLVVAQPYEQGLDYQRVVDSLQRAAEADYRLSMVQHDLRLQQNEIPTYLRPGILQWTRPDDPTLDRQFSVERGNLFSTESLPRGRWKLDYSFEEGGEIFRLRRTVDLN